MESLVVMYILRFFDVVTCIVSLGGFHDWKLDCCDLGDFSFFWEV